MISTPCEFRCRFVFSVQHYVLIAPIEIHTNVDRVQLVRGQTPPFLPVLRGVGARRALAVRTGRRGQSAAVQTAGQSQRRRCDAVARAHEAATGGGDRPERRDHESHPPQVRPRRRGRVRRPVRVRAGERGAQVRERPERIGQHEKGVVPVHAHVRAVDRPGAGRVRPGEEHRPGGRHADVDGGGCGDDGCGAGGRRVVAEHRRVGRPGHDHGAAGVLRHGRLRRRAEAPDAVQGRGPRPPRRAGRPRPGHRGHPSGGPPRPLARAQPRRRAGARAVPVRGRDRRGPAGLASSAARRRVVYTRPSGWAFNFFHPPRPALAESVFGPPRRLTARAFVPTVTLRSGSRFTACRNERSHGRFYFCHW